MPAAHSGPRTCAACRWWCVNYVGPQTWGFCLWREENDKSHNPRMNHSSTYRLTLCKSLETRHDAACQQWEPR